MGLADSVQMSAVLRHVRKYRPHWTVDYQAEEGKHQVGRGLVANTFAYGDPYPTHHYDCEVQILLYDTFANWHDRPNTRVSSCLHERFGLGWDAECGTYQVNISPEAELAADAAVRGCSPTSMKSNLYERRVVAVHYQGDSSQVKKNLNNFQAASICLFIEEQLGCVPLVLDWRERSPLAFRKLRSPSRWGGDAEMVCAVIKQCDAFVGIDSGPGKCASATNIPSLIVWTGHHPAPFHDPAPNTAHLVPDGYHGLEPVCNDQGVIDWFERHYNVRTYKGDPVGEIKNWLRETLQ